MQRVTMHMGAKLKKLLRTWASACFDLRPTIPPTPPLLPLLLNTCNQVIVFLVVHLAIKWLTGICTIVPTWNFDWIYDNDPFSTDDKKDKYAKTTTDPRGWALLLMSLLSPAVARYDSVYQLLTAFTSNHQVLTAFINGKCISFKCNAK